jgi:hypothetical protein
MSRKYSSMYAALWLSCCIACSCAPSPARKKAAAATSGSKGLGSASQQGDGSRSPSDAQDAAARTAQTQAADDSSVFVAFAADFKGFHAWPHYDVSLDDDAGPQHPEQRLIEYINHRPPHGSTAFALRTIIVKEGKTPPSASFFAMVKRGGDYNADGASGWEWFELQNLADDGVQIVWRGVGPPDGEGYGGDPNSGCNDCHTPDRNDSVLAPALDLRNF